MHDFINTYVYLLIAMISFIAPIMLFLLSIFSHGIVIVKKRADEELSQIQALLTVQLTTPNASLDVTSFIAKSHKSLMNNQKKNNKRLNLLNPKRQIIRTFSSLFLALGLIMADMLIREKPWHLYNHYVSMALIISSFLCLIGSMLILLQVGWEIIDTKRLLAEDENAVTLSGEGAPN